MFDSVEQFLEWLFTVEAIITIIPIRILWGLAAYIINRGKGYDTNWFWWGFLFGIVPAIIVSVRPTVYRPRSTSSGNQTSGWTCSCGKVNPSYLSTCSCGKNKRELSIERQQRKEEYERG